MERAELKKKIPHGYGQLIADKAGVSRVTVSKFLNGGTDNIKVEMAALEIAAELEERRKVLIDKIS